jgi:hypothetical protein
MFDVDEAATDFHDETEDELKNADIVDSVFYKIENKSREKRENEGKIKEIEITFHIKNDHASEFHFSIQEILMFNKIQTDIFHR